MSACIMKHPQPFSVQTQEICRRYEWRVNIQNDSMRLLDRTEERPDIENKGLRKHFIETSHTHSSSSIMVIYTYERHTDFITQRLLRTHTV